MVYGCGNQLVKFLVFTTNLLIFVFGGLIFGFSLWANLDQKFTQHLKEIMDQAKIDSSFVEQLEQYQASLWILTAIGAMLFLVGFLGCCGAACESLVLLTLFFIIVLILSLIEAFALIYLFVNRSGFLKALYNGLEESSKSAVGIQNLKPVMDLMTCCGATSESAFKYKCEGKLAGAPDCYTVISDKLESMSEIVIGVGVVLLIIQLFSMVFSCSLCRAFRARSPAYYA